MRLALVLFLLVLIVVLSVLVVVVLVLVPVLVVVLVLIFVLIFVLVVVLVLHNEHSFFCNLGITYSLCPTSTVFMRLSLARLPYELVKKCIKEGSKGDGRCYHHGNTDPPKPRVIDLKNRFGCNGSCCRKKQDFASKDLFFIPFIRPPL